MTIRRLSYLVVLSILAALVFYSFSRPGWESQLRDTALAMESARSWHLKVTAKPKGEQPFELQEEVICPKEYHSLKRTEPAEGNPGSGRELEVWVVGKDAVQRLDENLITMADRGWPPECGRKRLFELPGVPLYQVTIAMGHAVRGSRKTVGGAECRLWTVQLPKGDGWGDVYDLCIDKNNFPLELIMKDGSLVARASHWNETFELPKPPEVPATTTQ